MPIVAFDDQITTDEDTSLSGSVLADNGNGADSGSLMIVTEVNGVAVSVGQQITLPSGALLTLNLDGTFDYDPNGAFESLAGGATALDSFSYAVEGFAASLNLSSLDGTNGFVLSGIDSGDISGGSVASAGDVNGDGFDDLIIGAAFANPNGTRGAGESYVVFGRDTGFAANLNLSSLDGTNGFVLNGIDVSDWSGGSVASAGDVNGDGFDDLIIGASLADPNGSFSGESYVVFGSDTGFAASLNLASLDGTNGFVLNGINARDHSGWSVSSAGDVNGDGIDDLIIGAFQADPNRTHNAGESYVVFGRDTGFAASLNLSSLDGTNGFVLNGSTQGDRSGGSVSSAGDVNGDGIDDLIIGASFANPNGTNDAGESYVVFGRDTGFAANLNLASLDGTNGFVLNGIDGGDNSGWSVSSAGDLNGDGFDDLIIGARNGDPNGKTSAGESYVVFGRDTGFAASLNLASLDGTNGFVLNGIDWGDRSGWSVFSAGDVNGDGFDDLIIGAWLGDPNRTRGAGESYVVFGRDTGFAANLNLSSLDGTNGFVLNGIDVGDWSGESVATAGDVNGDGFDDLIIGAPHADPNGTSDAGESYVVFGRAKLSVDVATVTVTVGGVNDAPAIDPIAQTDVTETEDTSAITAGIDVTFTDVDLTDVGHTAEVTSTGVAGTTAGLSLTLADLTRLVTAGAVSKVSGSANGSLALAFSAASTGFDYLREGETVTLSYSVSIDDGDGGIGTQAFDVVVTGTNDRPVAADDVIAIDVRKTASGQVLADNGAGADSDPDAGSVLSVLAVNGTAGDVGVQISLPSGAFLTLNADGTFDYDPNGTFDSLAVGGTTTDSFSYTIEDGFGLSDTATVTFDLTRTGELLVGDEDPNTLLGGPGDDILLGNAGNDVLTGADGADSLTGGPGSDILQGGDGGVYHTEISAQVYRLYFAVLRREQDVAGREGWVEELTLGEMTLGEVAAAFVASPEFQQSYGRDTDRQFVNLLYLNMLGRGPSTVDEDFWVGQIEGGMPRGQVALLLSESPEHQSKTTAAQEAFDETHDITTWADDVYRLYRAIFDRDPDVGGFEVWTDALASTRWGFPQVVNYFMASPEFQSTYGAATSDAAFVTLLYQNVLGREPDPGGLVVWLVLLEEGVSRNAVVTGFMASPEFVANSEAGLTAFVERVGKDDVLVSDVGNDVLVGGLYSDRFVFVADGEASTTTVTDLEPWDVLEFRDFGLSEAQVLAAMTQQGEDVLFAAGDEAVLLLNTQLAEITEEMISIA